MVSTQEVDVLASFCREKGITPVAFKASNGVKYNVKRTYCIAKTYLVEIDDGRIVELTYSCGEDSWSLQKK